jgi:hypothetical protein
VEQALMAARIVPEGGWQSRLKPFRTPRVQNRRHLDFIKSLPCVCCLVEGKTNQADDPMHIREGSSLHGKDAAGAQQKSDDRWTLPGCRPHHNEQHQMDEAAFWRRYGVDHFLLALVLWGLTGQHYQAEQAIREHVRALPGLRGVGTDDVAGRRHAFVERTNGKGA